MVTAKVAQRQRVGGREQTDNFHLASRQAYNPALATKFALRFTFFSGLPPPAFSCNTPLVSSSQLCRPRCSAPPCPDGTMEEDTGKRVCMDVLKSSTLMKSFRIGQLESRVGHRVVTGVLGRGIRTVIDVPRIHGYRTRWNVESITE